MVFPVAEVSIPSPPAIVNVSPIVAAAEPLSLVSVTSFELTAPEVTEKLAVAKDATPLFDTVASSPVKVKVPPASS